MKEIFINKYPISIDLLLRSDPVNVIDRGNMFVVSHIQRDHIFMIAVDDIFGGGKEVIINLPVSAVGFVFEIQLLDD